MKKYFFLFGIIFLLLAGGGCAPLHSINPEKLNHKAMDLNNSLSPPNFFLTQTGPEATSLLSQSCTTCAK